MQKEQKQLLRQIELLLKTGDMAALQPVLGRQRSSDIAEVVSVLDSEDMRSVFNVLDKPTAAEVLEKLEEAHRSHIFELLTEEEIKTIFSEMDLDDVTDLLAELSDEISEKVLKSLPAADASEVKKLMTYSEDSAGGIMDPVVISVSQDATVAEAIDKIRAAEIDEDFFSIYVVDAHGRFLGDVRLRLLLTRPEQTRIRDLVDPDTIYVLSDDDQERVRNVFSHNDLIVVPVLDQNHKLIGRITADRVIEVAEEEAVEDLYVMAGTNPDELENFSVLHAARVRMTWLLPCMIGTSITALVLTFFHARFTSQNLPLVYTTVIVFVPMIAAISGNAGLQTSAIVVSGLAAGHLAALRLRQVFTREIRIAIVVALSCGIVGGVVCALLLNPDALTQVVEPLRIILAFGTAMFTAIMLATTLGLFLPFLFRRIGIDPAISSGPLVTTANDSLSVAIYMTLTLMMVT